MTVVLIDICTPREPELLSENGGPVSLNMTWAKSFLRRSRIKLGKQKSDAKEVN